MKALDGSFAGARAVVREARASVEGSFAALEAALAIIYPPAERPTAVECRCFTCRAYRSGHGSIAAVFKAHPVIAPTGDSGALREALALARDTLDEAEEELRMIRMKDSAAVYNTTLRSLGFGLARQKIDAALKGEPGK
jgi:hypothetical protein